MNSQIIINLSIIMVINILGMLVAIHGRKKYYSNFVGTFMTTFVIIMLNIIKFVTDDKKIIMFSECSYYALTCFQLIFVCTLIWNYTHDGKVPRWYHITIGVLGVLDVLLMIINVRSNIVFHIEYFTGRNGYTMFRVVNNLQGLYIHFTICAIIGAASYYALIKQIILCKGIYRMRYVIIFANLFFITVIGTITAYFDFPVEFIQACVVYVTISNLYFIDYFVPDHLLQKTIAEAMKSLDNGIVIFDAEGHLIASNEIAYQYLQVPIDDETKIKKRVEDIINERDAWEHDKDNWIIETIDKDNSKKYVEISSGRIRDEKDFVIGGFFGLFDRTKQQKELQAEHFKATHDELTGLYNKEGFYEEVSKKMHLQERDDYMIICTNVRDFKMINDLFGFDKGNEIIQKMGAMLALSIHKDEIIARIVADQFAILTTKSIYDENYFLDQLSGITNIITSSYYTMTIHCGIYEVTNPEMDVSLMCDRANMAISSIREVSGNGIATYKDNMMSSILRDRQVANHLDAAMKNDEFLIYLQAQVDKDGSPIGAEALVRWNDPKKGVLAPGAFIDILEKTGCLYKLDTFVWELAARQLSMWKGTIYEDMYLSVNVSPKDFYYIDIYAAFTSLVSKYKIDPSKLKIEITETALMNEPERQLSIINRLHNVGFEFEIDDFGSGYSALSMLKDMPADVLKIDMEFLHETENKERSRTILDSIIQLAHELDMKVVTEGVERKNQLDFLIDMGCNIFQGYYFSKPIPVIDFEEKYREHMLKKTRK